MAINKELMTDEFRKVLISNGVRVELIPSSIYTMETGFDAGVAWQKAQQEDNAIRCMWPDCIGRHKANGHFKTCLVGQALGFPR